MGGNTAPVRLDDILRSSQEDQPTNVDLRPKLKRFSVAQTAVLSVTMATG